MQCSVARIAGQEDLPSLHCTSDFIHIKFEQYGLSYIGICLCTAVIRHMGIALSRRPEFLVSPFIPGVRI